MQEFPINEFIIKIASRCNLNCTYCYEYNQGDDSWKRASKFMSLDTAVKLEDLTCESQVCPKPEAEPLLVKVTPEGIVIV